MIYTTKYPHGISELKGHSTKKIHYMVLCTTQQPAECFTLPVSWQQTPLKTVGRIFFVAVLRAGYSFLLLIRRFSHGYAAFLLF